MDIGNRCIALAISRGTILHSEEFDFIDHGKLFIVLGENEEEMVGFFFINSKISQYISRNPQFFAMQMSIKRSDYPDILIYDSFVGCHALTSIPKNELAIQINTGKTQIKGCLNERDINMMLDAVRNSDLFTEQEKNTFFK
ncbi:MAG: hypothetical protein LBV41_04775 [Cytophagaceae bacterium]|jgi:hypothetical protein|nr:hypothetical protein [Cytophagaceae bacterium]